MASTSSNDDSKPYVKNVTLENFMCHTKFSIDLGNRVNLICGTNGSGKSTILTALMVALGSRAKSTNRANSLGSLVKEGKSRTWIHVTMHVPEIYTQIYEKYGSELIITRSITSKGVSLCQIRDHAHRLVPKAGSRDVQTICNQFGIYPDNELAMLTQEMAKDFLVHTRPRVKYEKLKRALLQNSIKANIEFVEGAVDRQRVQSESLRLREEGCETRIVEAKSVLEKESRQKIRHERAEFIKALQSWRELEVKRKDFEVSEEACRQTQAELEDLQNQAQDGQHGSLTERYDSLQEESLQANERVEVAQQELQKAMEDINFEQRQLDRLLEDIPEYRSTVQRLGLETEHLEKLASDQSPEKAELERLRLENLLEGLRAEHDKETSNRSKIRESLEADAVKRNSSEIRVETLEAEITELVELKQTRTKELKELESGRSKSDVTTGDHKYHLLLQRLVKKEQNWTSEMPVGPLYSFIEVLDDGAEFTPALERIWGRTLDSWWVRNTQDRNMLRRLARGVPQLKLNIMVRDDDPYDFTSALPLASGAYKRAIDVIKVSYEPVIRILVDQNFIDGMVLTKGIDNAFKIVGGDNRVRDVIVIGSTKRGEQTFHRVLETEARRDTSTIDPLFLRRLKVGTTARRSLLSSEIIDCNRRIERLNAKIDVERDAFDKYSALVRQKESAVTKSKNKVRMLEDEIEDLNLKITRLQVQNDEEDYSLQARSKRTKIAELVLELRQAEDVERELRQRVETFTRKYEDCSKVLNELKAAYLEEESKFNEVKRALARFETDSRTREHLLITKTRRANELEGEMRVAHEIYKDEDTNFRENFIRFSVADLQNNEDSSSSLEEELNQLNREISLAEKSTIDLQEAQNNFAEACEEKKNITRIRKELEKDSENIEMSHKSRLENGKKAWDSIKLKIQHHFKTTLSRRSYRGEVIIDDKRQILDAKAEQESQNDVNEQREHVDRNTATLSGGEKSLTQISLLMAVWRTMELGLVSMDEYDVFMDRVNRSVSLRCIGESVEQSKVQCIIITPQDVDVSVLEGINFKFHKLQSAI